MTPPLSLRYGIANVVSNCWRVFRLEVVILSFPRASRRCFIEHVGQPIPSADPFPLLSYSLPFIISHVAWRAQLQDGHTPHDQVSGFTSVTE